MKNLAVSVAFAFSLLAVLAWSAQCAPVEASKPAPVSAPIATPTAVVPDKGIIGPAWGPQEGNLRPGAAQSINLPIVAKAARLAPAEGLAEDSVDIPWEGLVVYDLNEPPFDAGDLATKAARVFLGCEVKAWILAGNAPKDAVGAAGERGAPQIHPSWRQKMADMGLDIEVERDRWTFALWLAEKSGWQNWFFCQHTSEGANGTSYGGY